MACQCLTLLGDVVQCIADEVVGLSYETVSSLHERLALSPDTLKCLLQDIVHRPTHVLVELTSCVINEPCRSLGGVVHNTVDPASCLVYEALSSAEDCLPLSADSRQEIICPATCLIDKSSGAPEDRFAFPADTCQEPVGSATHLINETCCPL